MEPHVAAQTKQLIEDLPRSLRYLKQRSAAMKSAGTPLRCWMLGQLVAMTVLGAATIDVASRRRARRRTRYSIDRGRLVFVRWIYLKERPGNEASTCRTRPVRPNMQLASAFRLLRQQLPGRL